ncbi:MAG: glycosyltransferase family 4 protein [Caldilineaceae bacterium]|nr:glycosyltransferase family 4 protein [Caldilineaceae bacterium]
MTPIRVLEIINGFALGSRMGGAERFGVELAIHLDPEQIAPIVAGLWEWDPPVEAQWRTVLKQKGIETVVGPAKDDRAPLRNFVDAVRSIRAQVREPVDIIHSHCDFGDVAAYLLRRPLRVKVLVRTAHNELEWAKRPWRRWLLVYGLYPFVYDAELGVSTRVVEVLDRRPLARFLRRRGRVTYNAVDLGRFAQRTAADGAAIRHALGIPPGAPLIGTVGRLTAQKGYHILLQAAPLVLAQRPDAHFVIVGGGEQEAELKALAHQHGIEPRVHFPGARRDVEAIYPAMDIFVSASLWEGLPTVIMEAMASGVPVVATRVAGTVELVRHGETGLLVPPNDPTELAGALLKQLDQRKQALAMARAAYDWVDSRFSIQGVARGHERLYRELLHTR